MTYLEIRCNKCGRFKAVSEAMDFNDDSLRKCPRCNSEINEQTWKQFILPAFGMGADANRELKKDALNSGKFPFSIFISCRSEHSTGTVLSYDESRGFGFIQPDQLGVNVYFHATAVFENGGSRVKKGDRVQYSDVEINKRGVRAFTVLPLK